MHGQKVISFQDAIEIVESLPEEQQENLIEILKRRLIERRRNRLLRNVKEAKAEYKRGEVKSGTVGDLIRELSE